MKVQPLTKQQAVGRLQSEEAQFLRDNRMDRATAMIEARETLERGKGDDLWEIYTQARQDEARWERVVGMIVPKERTDGEKAKTFIGLSAGGVAVGVAGHYLRTGDLGQALALGGAASFLCLTDALFLAIGADTGVDLTRTLGAINATAVIAGMTANHWLPALLAGGATLTLATTVGSVAAHQAGKNRQIQQVITDNRQLFEAPSSPSTQLGSAITKRHILETLAKLSTKSREEGDYQGAMDAREDMQRLANLKGDTYHDMFLGTRGDERGRKLLTRYADAILDDARNREEIQALLQGDQAGTQLLIEEDAIEVGDQHLPVSS
ncbi:MAG: hypothetical protein AB7S38_08330 [Vulcanimicrobiota bacterium]